MERTIALEGCFNFRDLGGYPTADGRTVRWRQVYRSDALHLLTEDDICRVRDELRIGTVIDLRSSAELRSDGRGRLADAPIAFCHMPLFDGDTSTAESYTEVITLADRYALLADFAKEQIARVITAIAATGEPAVYHCAAGKDRTGVISAVLLGLLGVRDEIIVADYAATRENLDAIIERLMAAEGYQSMLAALPASTLHAEPGTMVAFLERLRGQYGSLREYALSAGVEAAAIDELTDRLLRS
jgi:protein-tyrosine phosphatase